MCVGPRLALCGPEKTRNKVQTKLIQLWSVCADSCVATSFPVGEDDVMLSVGEGILHVLGSYNGNVETGKNGDWMKIGVETPEGTNSRCAAQMADVSGL